jgi:purine-binding chemotaxis protein CheW
MSAQYCTFRLDGHLFGIPVETVQEVLRHQSMTVVPLAPKEVSGLLNLRGQIVVTVDLRVRLGLSERDAATPNVNVVVRTHDGTVSLLVDQIADVLEPPATSSEPLPHPVPAC